MVKPVEAALRLAYFRCLLLCNLFQTPGSFCKEYYLLIQNILGTRMEASILCFLELGYDK
jgi:hypothetical protein